MKSFKALAAASCLGLLALVPSAVADQWNKKTYITISEPIQVPGKTLQPGKYVLRLLESQSNRHIVQIFNEREDQLQTTILAIPNYRLQPTGKTEFQWWETPAGQPKAIRAWFYPGDNFGQEFAYPKSEAVAIATATHTTVPTTYAQTETDLATARVGTVNAVGTEMELDRKTYTRDTAKTEVAQARRTQMPASTQMPAATQMPASTQGAAAANDNSAASGRTTTMARNTGSRSRRLPKTASTMPAVALAGFLALGASLAIRAAGRV